MNYAIIIGVLVFLVLTYVARMINEKGLKLLDESKKALLIDAFSGQRKFITLPLIILILLFFAALKFFMEYYVFIISGYLVITIIYILAAVIISYRKLKKLDFPKSYLKFFIYSQIVRFTGIVLLFSFVFIPIARVY